MREVVLKKLILEHKLTKGAELGVWKGRVFKYLLAKCPNLDLIGVDLYEAQPDNPGPETWEPHSGVHGTHAWDHDTYYKDILKFLNNYPNSKLYKMYTNEAALKVENESLDFIFIDADHSYKGVTDDITNWTPKVKDTGFVTGHDIDWPDVKTAVEENFSSYEIKDDNVWIAKRSNYVK